MAIVAKISCKQNTGHPKLVITSPADIAWAVLHVAEIYHDADFDEQFAGGEISVVEIEMVEMTDEEIAALPEYDSEDYY